MKVTVVLLSFVLAVSAKVIPHRLDATCNNINPTTQYDDCTVDLTVALDMSSAMGSEANIAVMTDSVLNNFLPNFNFWNSFTSGLTFGSSVVASEYWDTYSGICNFIHQAEEGAIQLGLNYTSLSNVFQTYKLLLEKGGRNYRKVLILLTPKTDATEIAAAKVYSDQILADGVVIIVVGLAQDNTSALSTLSNYFYSTPGYAIPISNIPDVICSYSGITVSPPVVYPSGSPPPWSNVIGSPCSTNIANIWLDIIFVVDISNAMGKRELNNLATEIDSFMSDVNFGPRGPHNTRAGIISYATLPVTRLALHDGIDFDQFDDEIFDLQNHFVADDNGGYLQLALKSAMDMFNETKIADGPVNGIRKQVLILTVAAYNDIGFEGADVTAQTLKNDGVTIFTISYKSSQGVLPPGVDKLASPGYAFKSDQDGLDDALPLGLTQVNCFCPVGTLQFTLVHNNVMNVYADCFFVADVQSKPSVANRRGCPDGSLVSVTSQAKLDFISDQVINSTQMAIKKYITGAHKDVTNDQWYWSGYNSTVYPLGEFPVFSPSPSDSYAYLENYFGFNWRMTGTDDKTAMAFICQNKACDADFICDQS